jgi:pimeloyl-ACP methyl ester carboxylesterase
MKVKSPSLLFKSSVRMIAAITDLVISAGSAHQKRGLATSKAAFWILLALLASARWSSAQSSIQKGLPVIFVHGICDTPDSFVPAERDLMTYLGKQYPALYTNTIDFVAFYNGTSVGFQAPQGELPSGSPNPVYSGSEIDPDARFFLVALDDPSQPSQTSYEKFDPSVVADIPIYTKGNELAQIIWQVKVLTGAPRVIVVAHSMGGLDARAYIEGLASPTGSTDAAIPYFNDIAALVTLDTPHGGADASNWNWGGGIVNIPNSKEKCFRAVPIHGQEQPASFPR